MLKMAGPKLLIPKQIQTRLRLTMQGHSGGRVGGCHRKTSLQPSVDHETASLLLVFPRYPRETPENVGKMQMLKKYIYIYI
jgi:hypothetical protein